MGIFLIQTLDRVSSYFDTYLLTVFLFILKAEGAFATILLDILPASDFPSIFVSSVLIVQLARLQLEFVISKY